jgi:hypothetical protein
MEIKLSIPDNIAQRVIDGIAGAHGYQDVIIGIDDSETPNPETKAQFAKRVIIADIKNAVKSYEAIQAAETARITAIESVENEIEIT